MALLIFKFRERYMKAILNILYYSIDEFLEKFERKSKYIFQINTKAAGRNYKLYILNLQRDYLIDFKYINKITKIAEIKLTETTSRIISQLILNIMTTSLPPKSSRKKYTSYII
jgi:hypothetical protein